MQSFCSDKSKAYALTKKIVVSRNVVFQEDKVVISDNTHNKIYFLDLSTEGKYFYKEWPSYSKINLGKDFDKEYTSSVDKENGCHKDDVYSLSKSFPRLIFEYD